jgi:tRNA-specific 2-thiouridylase
MGGLESRTFRHQLRCLAKRDVPFAASQLVKKTRSLKIALQISQMKMRLNLKSTESAKSAVRLLRAFVVQQSERPMVVKKKKVVVAMSGGVDSSVAAALLLREGYDLVGVFMRLGSPNGVESPEETCEPAGAKHKQGCCSVLDADDARRVSGMLDIPFYVLNFQEDFGRVIDYFVSEYNRGRTPNPCVRCNDWLKFGRLAQYAKAVGADYVASGHYARIGVDPITEHPALLRGLDHRKDQSYVLFGMSQETLDHTLLPIGGYEKSAVRAIAEELKLPVFNKPDSQEICFVSNQDYAGLVQRRSPETFAAGELVTSTGEVVGEHQGHQHFTIGQRKGVGVAFGYPIYVVDINAENNRVTVGDKNQLLKHSLVAHQINLLSNRIRSASLKCTAKIRYNHDPQPAVAQLTAPDELSVRFDTPQSAITPGQAVVLYDGDVVLGGGWIDSASDE